MTQSLALPSFSVVINSLNRAASLAQTLDSFRWQSYAGSFEIIVVNGPSTDDTAAVLAAWSGKIRVGHCPAANLSMSRNIGICMARGDIVAFIDDDGIPEPEWLTQLAAAYADPLVGGAGGRVYDHTGYNFQAEYCLVDRFANADENAYRRAMPQRCFPGSFQFPHLLGTNASFRRDALLSIAGFDEEFEYFLDETDVCLRLIDAGWLIRQLPDAYVHHKFAPSSLRTEKKVLKYYYPVIKNKIYFTLKHAGDYVAPERIAEEQQRFITKLRNDLRWCIENKLREPGAEIPFEQDVARALTVGRQRGAQGPLAMITPDSLERYGAGGFLSFPTLPAEGALCIVLVTADYPPDHGGGIATFNRDLAAALAALGHRVHVVCQSKDLNRVDFEGGVWVHRILTNACPRSEAALERAVPEQIWNWSSSALMEVKRISSHRRIDVVETPIWDCQGIAFHLEGAWPLVVSLQTSLAFFLESHPELAASRQWMADFGTPMLRLEKELMQGANAIRAISQAIKDDIERSYQFHFDPEQVVVAPLGLQTIDPPAGAARDDRCRLLFVGRLEHRKGIDVLLQSLPLVLAAEPGLSVHIVGDDTIKGPSGKSYRKQFEASPAGRALAGRIVFKGRIDDAAVRAEYAECDIFVAPSRYESFGLIFLEAMRAAKPVIGCRVGGMPEIIAAEDNGLLVPPDDATLLAAAILRLAREPDLRRRMGQRGRAMFLEHFSAEAMAAGSLSIYQRAMVRPPKRKTVKISFVNGVCVQHDAISAAIRGEITALRAAGHDQVRLYTYKCDFADVPHQIVAGPEQILQDRHFQDSDLVLFHFGIYSPLFALLPQVAGNKRTLVVFHNITPKDVIAPGDYPLYEQSLAQMRTIVSADQVICDSATNLAVLQEQGVSLPATILPLAVRLAETSDLPKPSAKDGTLRLLFIGRFVGSKGVRDLFAALELAVARITAPVQLDLVGNRGFSDPAILAELDNWTAQLRQKAPERIRVNFHFDASEDDKAELLRQADLFLLPSYHEGFCLPVVEALAMGCQVVTYDNSNLPAIGGGLSHLVRTGDVAAFAETVVRVAAEIAASDWRNGGYAQFTDAARSYVGHFDPSAVDQRFVSFIEGFAG